MQTVCTATEALRNHLKTGHWLPGERLPSLKNLAETYGVSRSTMQRALKSLQADSVVHVNPRGAIFAGPKGSAPAGGSPTSHGLIWERLKSRIGEDVLTGVFSDGPLPPSNKLALKYGVSVLTLRKALKQLVRDGLLVGQGSRLASARSRIARKVPRLVLIAAGEEGVPLAVPGTPISAIAECFERSCQRLHFESHAVGYNDRSPTHLLKMSRALKSITDIAGFVVAMWNPFEEIFRTRWNEMLALLCRQNVPVIVIDLAGDIALAPNILRQNNLRMLRIAGKRAGEIVAESLLRRGHRRIAYLSPSFSVSWAKDRYTGLCNYLTAYGGSKAKIELFAQSEMSDVADLVVEYLGLDKGRLRILLNERYSPEGLEVMLDRADRAKKQRLLGPLDNDPRVITVRAEALNQIALLRGMHDPLTMSRIFDALYDRASTYALERYLAPFFKRALNDSQSSAWVISDDKTATTALEYLSHNKPASHKELAVVSFDNTAYAFSAELSSFDFNLEGMVSQALSMIVDPKILKGKPAIGEVDGYVVERRTTRRYVV